MKCERLMFSNISLSDPSVVCGVLSVCPVPARHGCVHTDKQTAGCRSGLTRGWRDGRQHRPWSGLHHPSGDLLLLWNRSEVCWQALSLSVAQPAAAAAACLIVILIPSSNSLRHSSSFLLLCSSLISWTVHNPSRFSVDEVSNFQYYAHAIYQTSEISLSQNNDTFFFQFLKCEDLLRYHLWGFRCLVK